ncbi:PspA/IM30 family protein [Cytobacillus sp. S13-E01]|uniref:PspA/IM30 family protein n=1 Tax=Cytobacillus sp. S13-E01 TaxID=3031326 RepID=UPI0023D8A388|nr:PspA/IM30 family protein [Cytobacillus sp. S13-E01]MDF0726849.1 PspA/IM30 family protein [Cytobacillus sp. S13-E01]
MFEFFKRVKTVVSSEMHAMIDKAEDPEKMLDQYLREMERDIGEIEAATAKVMADEKLLNKKVADTEGLVTKREQQAMQALETSNEELAKKALVDKRKVSEELIQLKSLHSETVKNVEDMKSKLKEMKVEYRELELKKQSLKTRANSAKARTKANHTLSSLNSEGSKKGFERMEEKILRFEAEADTSEDMRISTFTLEDELSKLDTNTQVDRELEELKARVQENKSKE